ncbi:hypothetical protein HPP92_008400 [Vanilla planifolia]|uniref:Uncharacterized protein n=1 Tax=Vanilla planifolia TaxID=51239 RepID=A0A835R7Z1_VANPL|nr:hypothetical protein HPP92_008400 [Vanilla planifolia]
MPTNTNLHSARKSKSGPGISTGRSTPPNAKRPLIENITLCFRPLVLKAALLCCARPELGESLSSRATQTLWHFGEFGRLAVVFTKAVEPWEVYRSASLYSTVLLLWFLKYGFYVGRMLCFACIFASILAG